MTYLGTNLCPEDYYSQHSNSYVNGQEDAVVQLVEVLTPEFYNMNVVDLGCGAGLATKTLQDRGYPNTFIGIDSSPEMIKRYEKERQCEGGVRNFWQELPSCDVILACHCLHLCPDERLYQAKTSIIESGARYMIMTSPNKNLIEKFDFHVYEYLYAISGEKKKRVHGWRVKVKL